MVIFDAAAPAALCAASLKQKNVKFVGGRQLAQARNQLALVRFRASVSPAQTGWKNAKFSCLQQVPVKGLELGQRELPWSYSVR